MSFFGDALKTIESVVLLRSKVERLDHELERTNGEVREIVKIVVKLDRRLVRLETLEEVRSGARPLPKLEG
ncbi:MAG TPA: hypothetical protein VFK19_10490 [Sphingomicrobium sp.]|nr:hypothetical protein [Sphingomicrobium sp.]